MTKTFYFENIVAAAKFIKANGIPSAALMVLARNTSGVATYCEVTAPAEWF